MSLKNRFSKLAERHKDIEQSELDDFFDQLAAVDPDELLGEWKLGYFFTRDGTGSLWERFIKHSPIRLYSKIFINRNNVKAWVLSVFGIRLIFPRKGAVLRELVFREKISTSMIYDYLPMIDNFRKIDKSTVMGIMEVKGKTSVYFYLSKI